MRPLTHRRLYFQMEFPNSAPNAVALYRLSNFASYSSEGQELAPRRKRCVFFLSAPGRNLRSKMASFFPNPETEKRPRTLFGLFPDAICLTQPTCSRFTALAKKDMTNSKSEVDFLVSSIFDFESESTVLYSMLYGTSFLGTVFVRK